MIELIFLWWWIPSGILGVVLFLLYLYYKEVKYYKSRFPLKNIKNLFLDSKISKFGLGLMLIIFSLIGPLAIICVGFMCFLDWSFW